MYCNDKKHINTFKNFTKKQSELVLKEEKSVFIY